MNLKLSNNTIGLTFTQDSKLISIFVLGSSIDQIDRGALVEVCCYVVNNEMIFYYQEFLFGMNNNVII